MVETDAEFIARIKAQAEGRGEKHLRATFRSLIAMVEERDSDIDALAGKPPGHWKENLCAAHRERDDALSRAEAAESAQRECVAEVARLRKVLELIEIKQLDGDGIVWASFTTPHRQSGSFNLGTADKFATKVVLEFERLRSAALAPKDHPHD